MFNIENNHLRLLEEFNLENTKDRLIKVALIMFAENGYDKTSVRELAKKAEVNIAAINYHFSGKEGLYHAVLEYITEYMNSWAMPLLKEYEYFLKKQNNKFNIDQTIKWIESFLDTFMNTAFESYETNIILHKIIRREQLKPTFAFDKIYGIATIKLVEHIISDLFSKISKKDINDELIIIYSLSIISQLEAFIYVDSAIKNQLNVKELTKTQVKIIKKIILNQIENIILTLSKLNT